MTLHGHRVTYTTAGASGPLLGGAIAEHLKDTASHLVIAGPDVEAVDDDRVTLDVPLTCALEKEFGGGQIVAYSWPGRIRQVGVVDRHGRVLAGSREWIGTYTAYNGAAIRSELLRTRDFRTFTLSPMGGPAAWPSRSWSRSIRRQRTLPAVPANGGTGNSRPPWRVSHCQKRC